MKCEKCGFSLKETDTFCSTCGAQVIKPQVENEKPVFEEPSVEVLDVDLVEQQVMAAPIQPAVEPVMAAPIQPVVEPVMAAPIQPVVEPMMVSPIQPVVEPVVMASNNNYNPNINTFSENKEPNFVNNNSNFILKNKKILGIVGGLLALVLIIIAVIIAFPDLLYKANLETYKGEGYEFDYDVDKWVVDDYTIELKGYEDSEEIFFILPYLRKSDSYDFSKKDDRNKIEEEIVKSVNNQLEESDFKIMSKSSNFIEGNDDIYHFCFKVEMEKEYTYSCFIVDAKYNQIANIQLYYSEKMINQKLDNDFMRMVKSFRVTEEVSDSEYDDYDEEYIYAYPPFEWELDDKLSVNGHEVYIYEDNFTKLDVTAFVSSKTPADTVESLIIDLGANYPSKAFKSTVGNIEFDDGEDIIWTKATSENYIDEKNNHSYYDVVYIGQMTNYQDKEVSYIVKFSISNELSASELSSVEKDIIETMEYLSLY
jgi:hypothetical protein